MILAGDIGGTKTLLALFEPNADGLNKIAEARFSSQAYTSFDDLLEDFLTQHDSISIDAVAIGVAGPVIDQTCRTTNLPWVLRATDIANQTGARYATLLNDLQATAYGMLHLPDDDFFTLNDAKRASGNIAVIAAGTGLGEAMLFHDESGRWHPVATEGGHCDFAPRDAQQERLLHWLNQRYPEHVSYERVVSGPGIRRLYEFLHSEGVRGEVESESFPPDPAWITLQAEDRGDALCRETLHLFARIYGAEAGNLALKTLARGGIYLGGGITPKILPFLESGGFLNALTAKGRFREMLVSIPVKVALNEETALLGAAWYAHSRND